MERNLKLPLDDRIQKKKKNEQPFLKPYATNEMTVLLPNQQQREIEFIF